MRITAIKQQAKRSDRYSIFVDGKYAFSLSDGALLENGLVSGQEISDQRVKELKQTSADDKLYAQALRYTSLRLKSEGEVAQYLKGKGASPSLSNVILNKLRELNLLDDRRLAEAYVNDRTTLRPASRRTIFFELKKKYVPKEIIEAVLSEHTENIDQDALAAIIAKKRRQTKYQDDTKLLQYLARQGFRYNDIKQALELASENMVE